MPNPIIEMWQDQLTDAVMKIRVLEDRILEMRREVRGYQKTAKGLMKQISDERDKVGDEPPLPFGPIEDIDPLAPEEA